MKLILTFKTPDVLRNALDYQAQALTRDEKQCIITQAARYIQYDEYLRVVYDTETNTMKILEVNE